MSVISAVSEIAHHFHATWQMLHAACWHCAARFVLTCFHGPTIRGRVPGAMGVHPASFDWIGDRGKWLPFVPTLGFHPIAADCCRA